jgi:Rieske Fe-S protein
MAAENARSKSTHSASTRRRFVNWILGTSAGGLVLSVLYPTTRYLIPPEAAESTASTVTLQISPDEIGPNTGQIFRFGSRPGILIRTPDGDLRAYEAMCTHLDCIVQYRDDISRIWCACHNGHYDLNGINIQGPPPRPLQRFTVNVQEDRIVIGRES